VHQNAFVGRAPLGSAGEAYIAPQTLAKLRGGQWKRGGEGGVKGGKKEGKTERGGPPMFEVR